MTPLFSIYLNNLNDSLAIRNNFPNPVIPGHLCIRRLCRDFKLHCVLLHAIHGLQLRGECVGVGVNLEREMS